VGIPAKAAGMGSSANKQWLLGLTLLTAMLGGVGCSSSEAKAQAGEKPKVSRPIIQVQTPPANGPKLASVVAITAIHEQPYRDSPLLGYLHSGGKATRSKDAISKDNCEGGWYAVLPKGFVCLDEGATTDMNHPLLKVMATQPSMDQPLPYTYASVKTKAGVYEYAADNNLSFRKVSEIAEYTRLALIGSWRTKTKSGDSVEFGTLTDGRFIRASDLRAAKSMEFQGYTVDEMHPMPVAYVVKSHVKPYKFKDEGVDRLPPLEHLSIVKLNGKYRTKGKYKFWGVADGSHVLHRDVTVIQARERFPDWVAPNTKWIDISTVMGSMVLYQGKTPVYATLVSVGEDKFGGVNHSHEGTFYITGKHITAQTIVPEKFEKHIEIRDTPWVLELSSGQTIHASFWHTRFGIEHGPGNIQLAPKDAKHVWDWVGIPIPEGWHAVMVADDNPLPVRVVVRK
jgi:hypothetical protein